MVVFYRGRSTAVEAIGATEEGVVEASFGVLHVHGGALHPLL
jgi:hypothetical protein